MVVQSSPQASLLAGIEAGGTKFNCVVGTGAGDILAKSSFPTTTPIETLRAVEQFFIAQQEQFGTLNALGIASFGPVDLNRESRTYGHILTTPKPGWSMIDMRGYFARAFNVPVAFETDVNGSALGEYHYGAARCVDNFVYVTVGTGIGAGVMINGRLLQGVGHPELGHMLVPQDFSKDSFSGCCPFHGNCLEGLASGTAITARWKKPANQLSSNHQVWALEAHYLALMCVNITHLFSPQKIILGGGVMSQALLLPMIRVNFLRLINGYAAAQVLEQADQFIVAPGVEDGMSGMRGALWLASSVA